MRMDDVIQIVKPQPDCQYRLLDCSCGSDNVAYVEYRDGENELWRVQCFDCGCTSRGKTPVRHEAQVAWNKRVKEAS